jgi:hypothetical protein
MGNQKPQIEDKTDRQTDTTIGKIVQKDKPGSPKHNLEKLTIKHHEPHRKPGVTSCVPEMQALVMKYLMR